MVLVKHYSAGAFAVWTRIFCAISVLFVDSFVSTMDSAGPGGPEHPAPLVGSAAASGLDRPDRGSLGEIMQGMKWLAFVRPFLFAIAPSSVEVL